MKHIKYYHSPVGRLAMITDGKALNELLLEKEAINRNIAEGGNAGEIAEAAAEIFRLTSLWLDRYFEGAEIANPQLLMGAMALKDAWELNTPGSRKAQLTYSLEIDGEILYLRPEGSEFKQEVWRLLCEIPYGETVAYGDIAEEMARIRGKKKMSAQAVGGAVGSNPISIMIPCHRVVGKTGSLTGYGGGLPVKIKLLGLEGLDMTKFTISTKGTKL